MAMTRTLFLVNRYQQAGYMGFYHAANYLPPDCEVTPWLIYQWLTIFIKGFQRGHPILSVQFELRDIGACISRKKEMSHVWQYFSAVAANKSSPAAKEVVLAVIWYSNRTQRHLFGTSSSQRPASA